MLGLSSSQRLGGLVLGACLLLLAAIRHALPARSSGPATLHSGGAWVEVSGDVERPGLRRLGARSTVRRALRVAGAACGAVPDAPLRGGERLRVDGCRVRAGRLPAPWRLTLGLPFDPNSDGAQALELLPGIGPRLADAIVRGRPYASVDDLDRVRGIGPKTLEKLRPLLEVRSVGPR